MKKNNTVITLSVLVIILTLLAFVINKRNTISNESFENQINRVENVSSSDDIDSIAEDLDSTEIDEIDKDLYSLESELNSSLTQ